MRIRFKLLSMGQPNLSLPLVRDSEDSTVSQVAWCLWHSTSIYNVVFVFLPCNLYCHHSQCWKSTGEAIEGEMAKVARCLQWSTVPVVQLSQL